MEEQTLPDLAESSRNQAHLAEGFVSVYLATKILVLLLGALMANPVINGLYVREASFMIACRTAENEIKNSVQDFHWKSLNVVHGDELDYT